MKNAIALIALLALNASAIDFVGGGCTTDCSMETLDLTGTAPSLTATGANVNGQLKVSSAPIITDGSAGEVIIDRSQASDAAGSGHALKIIGNGGGAYTTLGLFKGASAMAYLGYGNSGSILTGASANSFSIRAENDLHLGSGGNNLIATLTGGKVGIGTTSPASKLHVSSGAATSVLIDGNAPMAMQVGSTLTWTSNGSHGFRGNLTPDFDFDPGPVGTSRGVYGVYSDGNGGAFYGLGFVSGGLTTLWANGEVMLQAHYLGQIGIGLVSTQIPQAKLEVRTKAADNFAITTSSQSEVITWGVDKFGHVVSSGAAPAIGTCTNGAVLAGSTDVSGRVTFSGANSSCSITFAYAAQPAQTVNCAVSTNMATPAVSNVTATGTTLTVVTSAFANTDYFSYICYRNGGTY